MQDKLQESVDKHSLTTMAFSRQHGFTIIEVLIVLAIAGLIMIVVFLAVPTLNRNQHNQQYKTEAKNIMAAYKEVYANNGGVALNVSNSGVSPPNDSLSILNSANTKFFTTVKIAASIGTQSPVLGLAVIEQGATCNSPTDNTPITGSSSQIALVYRIEASGSTGSFQCLAS